MDVKFSTSDLKRLAEDANYDGGFPPEVLIKYRMRLQAISNAIDERAFYAMKSLHFEKLKGNRSHQRSMRLDVQWRLVIEIEKENQRTRFASWVSRITMNDGKGMNMDSYIPAQTFHPGVFIKEEIDERGWTQGDLAAIIGRPIQVVNELIAGKKAITADTARALGEAFGTGPEFWMNLESSWRLSQATPADGSIGRRAKLFGVAPVQELVRRNWIAPAADDAVFERSVLSFMKISSIEDKPQVLAAARKSSKDVVFTPSQVAWLRRAEFLAQNLQVKSFSKKQFLSAVADLRDLAGHEADVRRVPRFLAEIGVRLVVIEHLQGTKIDGAAFWLDSKSPVVALSMRYDRIDYFWYTLGHELGHVKNGDGQVFFDDDLVAAQHRDEAERLADEFASELLVPPTELDDFINRVRPLYSRQKIAGFASRMGVHPAIVIGQLQHRGEIGYWHSRPLLAKVRSILLESAIYDGWGHSIGAQGEQAK